MSSLNGSIIYSMRVGWVWREYAASNLVAVLRDYALAMRLPRFLRSLVMTQFTKKAQITTMSLRGGTTKQPRSYACGLCTGDEVAALPAVARNDKVY